MPTAYLVQYGRPGFVGPFTAPADITAARGDVAVLRSPRGVELGTVLGPVGGRLAAGLDPAAGGELLRLAVVGDIAGADQAAACGADLLAAAGDLAAARDLPLTFLDAEVLLDGGPAVLHAVAWGACDADPLFAELTTRFGRPVRLFDVSRQAGAVDPPVPEKGCGKPGCGSDGGGSCGTGGGCSTGSCSRGAVKTADDMTAYFAGLRTQMDAADRRTPLH